MMLNPAQRHAVNSIIGKAETIVRAAQAKKEVEPVAHLFQQILEIGKPKSKVVKSALKELATHMMLAVMDRLNSRMTPKLEYEVDARVMSIIDHWQAHYGYVLIDVTNRELYNKIHQHQTELMNQYMK